MWDLAVVGAGPAGASAALAALSADPSASVLLIDRADFPRDKPCGDGIAPHAVDLLTALGATDAVAGFAPVSRLGLGFAKGPRVDGVMRRPAYVVPRTVFDARLAAAAVRRGATYERRRVRDVAVCGDHVVLDGDIRARVAVGADGANGVVRRAMGVPKPDAQHVAVAIRGYAPVSSGRGDRQLITFADEGWPAYAWSFPIGDGRANVGYGETLRPGRRHLTRADLLSRLENLLPGAADHGMDWRAHHLPLSSGRPRQPHGRVLLAGDALSLINPLTGEGIYYAVLSGGLAGHAAVTSTRRGDDPGANYAHALATELGRHLRHTTVVARLARRRPAVDAAVHAASRNRAVFDDFVELGLGRGLVTPRLLGALLRSATRG